MMVTALLATRAELRELASLVPGALLLTVEGESAVYVPKSAWYEAVTATVANNETFRLMLDGQHVALQRMAVEFLLEDSKPANE